MNNNFCNTAFVKIKQALRSPYFVFVCFFAVYYCLLFPLELRPGSDDTAHFEALERLGIFGWLAERIETWQPRVVSDVCFAVFLNYLWLWKILNALIMTLVLAGVYRLAAILPTTNESSFEGATLQSTERLNSADLGSSSDTITRATLGVRESRLFAVLICMMFFFVHPHVILSGTVWYSGSFYYLWPFAAMLVALTPYFRLVYGGEPTAGKPWSIPLFMLCALLAGYIEQTVAITVCFSALALAYGRRIYRKVPRWLYAQFALTVANGAFFFYLDFTSERVRTGAENDLFPLFEYFSKVDKLLLGLNNLDDHYLRVSNILFLILTLTCWYIISHKRKGIVRLLAGFPAFVALANAFPYGTLLSGLWHHTTDTAQITGTASAMLNDPKDWLDFVQNVPPMNGGASFWTTLPAIIAFVAIISVLGLLWIAPGRRCERFALCVLYLAVLGSGAIMGFSPTIFASGARPFFAGNIFMILIICALMRDAALSCDPGLSQPFRIRTKTSRLLFGIAALIAVFSVSLYKYVFVSNYYWWY